MAANQAGGAGDRTDDAAVGDQEDRAGAGPRRQFGDPDGRGGDSAVENGAAFTSWRRIDEPVREALHLSRPSLLDLGEGVAAPLACVELAQAFVDNGDTMQAQLVGEKLSRLAGAGEVGAGDEVKAAEPGLPGDSTGRDGCLPTTVGGQGRVGLSLPKPARVPFRLRVAE